MTAGHLPVQASIAPKRVSPLPALIALAALHLAGLLQAMELGPELLPNHDFADFPTKLAFPRPSLRRAPD